MDSKVNDPTGHNEHDVSTRYSGGSRSGTKAKGWKTFLSPGWIISALLIVTFSYAAISMLAPWQLHKDDDIVARNAQITEAFERDVVPYAELFDASGEIPSTQEFFRVSLTGHYLPDSEVLLRLRPVDSGPAFQSLTPFELEDGRVVLVNRGYESSEGTIVPEIEPAPSTPVTITGFARKNEGVPSTAPMEDSGYSQVYGISTEQISEITGLGLGTDYVQVAEGEPGVLNAMPLPQMDRGNHLSYGFQWIAFGIMAPLGLGYFVWAEMRERRRDKAERAQMAELSTSEPVVETPEPTITPTASKRRSRYGDQHRNHYEKIAKRNEDRF
ncbi:SURF1 family cytochrome oxidase biogenesis protein [Corynebacterium suranareeae]|uniref:SURF1 family cytochrome oxidase biogenesis protein n=1 Tax=Corynebacterium suranareeae TaxID=2506452 RepID=UPI00142DB205|nr:SURF1 family protein [Corynebacterium suranareeae]